MKRLLAIVALAALAVAGQVMLALRRPVKSPSMEEGVFAALGGLRSVVSEVIWFRADRLQEEGRYGSILFEVLAEKSYVPAIP